MASARSPVRTCIGCRGRGPKEDLLRIVRADRGAACDPTGSAPGRGAYVHRDPGCVRAALRKGALAQALRSGLTGDELGRLQADIDRRIGAS